MGPGCPDFGRDGRLIVPRGTEAADLAARSVRAGQCSILDSFGSNVNKLGKLFKLPLVLALCSLLTAPGWAQAPEWPQRAVTIVVPYPPGGISDTVARIIAQKLQTQWKQAVVVDNRAGASGNIGARMVAKSAPDGHTLLVGGPNNFAANQFLFTRLGYDIEKDLTGIVVLVRHPVVLAVPAALGITGVKAFVAASKARPGKFSCGLPGVATLPHLAMELFKDASGADLQYIPYKGSSALLPDFLGGRLECLFDGLPSHAEAIKSGAYRALAVTTRERWSLMPDIPTFAEAGFPTVEATVWFALAAPADTPASVQRTISAAVNGVLREQDTINRFKALGVSIGGGSIEETNAFFRSEAAKWQRIIKAADIRHD